MHAVTIMHKFRAIILLGILTGFIEGKSKKKGLCIPPGTNFHCGDLAAFNNVRYIDIFCKTHICFKCQSSWWYNWHVKPNHEKTPPEDFCTCDTGTCGSVPGNKEFIPMVWGYDETDRPWHDDINDEVEDKYPIILGFNEPNHSDQSDIPPEEAAAAWIELQTKYPDRVKLEDR